MLRISLKGTVPRHSQNTEDLEAQDGSVVRKHRLISYREYKLSFLNSH